MSVLGFSRRPQRVCKLSRDRHRNSPKRDASFSLRKGLVRGLILQVSIRGNFKESPALGEKPKV